MIDRHTFEGIAGADLRDGTLIAIHASIVAHLQVERTVAKPIATFHTSPAADAEFLIDGVLVVRILDERALDGVGRAELVFSSGIKIVRIGDEITGAQLAVTADRVRMNALHGRLWQHAMSGAFVAAQTARRIDLPDSRFRLAAQCDSSGERAQAGHRGEASPVT